MASNNYNNNNASRRDREDRNHFRNFEESSSYAPEFMDAEDSLLEVRSSLNKMEKNEVLAEKLVDKDFYRDFTDVFDPDL